MGTGGGGPVGLWKVSQEQDFSLTQKMEAMVHLRLWSDIPNFPHFFTWTPPPTKTFWESVCVNGTLCMEKTHARIINEKWRLEKATTCNLKILCHN